MSLNDSRDRLLSAALELCWAQWVELGVSGRSRRAAPMVDPEALLAFTLTFGRYDPRLFDEVLDWVVAQGRWLDVSRLRRLVAGLPEAERMIAGAMLELMRSRSTDAKWGALGQRVAEERALYQALPLFLALDGEPLALVQEPDPLFARYGVARPPVELRGLSRPPDPSRPALVRLRMRALVGVGVRAEVLAYLCTHDEAWGRLIARRGLYTQRAVASVLDDLKRAGLARARTEGRKTLYGATPRLRGLAGSQQPYVDWAAAFRAVAHLWRGLEEGRSGTSSDYMLSSGLRVVTKEASPDLAAEGFSIIPPDTDRFPGEAWLDAFSELTDTISARFEGRARSSDFLRERAVWRDALESDDMHSIGNQVSRMLSATGIYRMLLKAWTTAPKTPEGAPKVNFMLFRQTREWFLQTQAAALRRLTDSSYGLRHETRGVTSLVVLLEDLSEHAALITRENLEATAEPWADAEHSEHVNVLLDQALGSAATDRRPTDAYPPALFTTFAMTLVERARSWTRYADKYVAHAASASNRAAHDNTELALGDLLAAQELVVGVCNFLEVGVLGRGRHFYMAGRQPDEWDFIEEPLVPAHRVPALKGAWDEYASETAEWTLSFESVLDRVTATPPDSR